MPRISSCSCRQLQIECEGEPVRTSVCHCLECQRRTGSVFGAQVRFLEGQVHPRGEAKRFSRRADSGGLVELNFCPECGSTVYWRLESQP